MTDADPPGEPVETSEEPRYVDSDPIHLSASADITSNPTVERSSAEGQQEFSVARGKHELKVEADAHKRQIERATLEHQQEQDRKDNDARREREAKELAARLRRDDIVFMLVVGGTIAGLAVGVLAALGSSNETTQRWGQALVTLIIGGLVGYFTGSKVGK